MDERVQLLDDLSTEFDRLRPRVIRPAEGFIARDYLVPGGFYGQMWDWDGFFIGCHLASRSRAKARYLRWWAENFAAAVDEEGYAAGCITPAGPRPLFGKFAMKPFLCQGVLIAARSLDDWSWVGSLFPKLERVSAYRERTQFDPRFGLFFWDNAMQSGADNNVAADRSAILAADINAFQRREYAALSRIAGRVGKSEEAGAYADKADGLGAAMLEHLWFEADASFFNVRRDTGAPVERVTYSNFVPLMDNLLPREEGRRTIERYLWNEDHLRGRFGLRTLSRRDPDYNNRNIIVPYSNWQGPVWPIANFLYSLGLWNYGFEAEAAELAEALGRLLLADIRACGSMHENYDAETGAPLAPTAGQSPGGVFTGFVGWNLLVQNMVEAAVEGRWLSLEV
jgi:alpha,alpha-trehalase